MRHRIKLNSRSIKLAFILLVTIPFVIFPFKGPENKELQVGNLQAGLFVEDQESNTFNVNFTWETPSFKHSTVLSYIISYQLDGYSREKISCSPGLVRDKDRSGCSSSGVVS